METQTRATANAAVQRTCAHCDAPIPAEKNRAAIYCHRNCSRKACYHRMTPEHRAEINRRSNHRRFQQDLLPRIRSISKVPPEITPGSPLGTYVAIHFLTARLSDWRLDLTLNFSSVRDTLAALVGGHTALEALEDMIFTKSLAIQDRSAAAC